MAYPSNTLITGASSGIGLAFAHHYLRNQPQTRLILTDINGPPSDLVQSTNSDRVVFHQTDFSCTGSITALVQAVTATHGIDHINTVIHSAGIRGLVPSIEGSNPSDVAAAETLNAMDAETMMRTYQINTLGTFTMLQQLVLRGLLRPGLNDAESKVVIMTSRMGSLSYNTAGGGYAYRASKAALNAIVRSMSIDVPDVIFCLMHPGRVATNLVKIREEGAFGVEETVVEMHSTISNLKIEDSGRFMDRFGVDIGW